MSEEKIEQTDDEAEREAFNNEIDEVEFEAEEPEIEVEPKVEPKAEEPPWAKIENRLRTMEGRFGSINSTVNTLTSEIHKIAASSKDGPTKKEVDDAVASGSLAALAEEYPDIGGKMLEMDGRFQAQLDELKKTKPVTFDEKEVRQKAMMDYHYMNKEMVVKGEDGEEIREPADWEKMLGSKEFGQWFAEQDPKTQELAQSPYARDAMKLLDSYLGLDNDPPVSDRNQRRLQAAVSPSKTRASSGSGVPTEQEAFNKAFKTGKLSSA